MPYSRFSSAIVCECVLPLEFVIFVVYVSVFTRASVCVFVCVMVRLRVRVRV